MPAAENRFSLSLAAILIFVGALLLFGNAGWFAIGSLFEVLARWWPVIFIVRGIVRMRGGSAGFGRGIRDLAFGVVMQVIMLGWLPSNLTAYWPYALIAVGLWLLLVPAKDATLEKEIDAAEVNETFWLRAAVLTVVAPRFYAGRLRSVASVVECDLSRCDAGAPVMRFELTATLSRLRLHVSDATRITVEAVRGDTSVADRRDLGNPPEGSDAPELVITGSFTFSSLEILDPPSPEAASED